MLLTGCREFNAGTSGPSFSKHSIELSILLASRHFAIRHQVPNQPTHRSFHKLDQLHHGQAVTTTAAAVAVAVGTVAAIIALASTAPLTSVATMPTGTWPTSKGSVKHSEPYTVKAGTTFDVGMKTYERSNAQCTGDSKGGSASAVFLVEAGGTLKNVIIGAAQTEGVHCEQSGCTIENVWWSDVCEDALSIKGGSASSVSKVIGGGARYADDKVIQQNGYDTVSIDGFYVQDFGKLYRACGNCKAGKIQRKVTVSNVYAVNPKTGIVTINKNYGDEATLSNIKIKTSKKVDKITVCAWSQSVTSGEPGELGSRPSSPLCQCATSGITYTS